MLQGISKYFQINLFVRFSIISVCLLLILFSLNREANAGSATLTWTTPTANSDGTPLTNLAGYKVYFGTASRVYGTPIDLGLNVGNPPAYTVSNLGTGAYYFAITAYNSAGQESSFSNEGTKTFTGPVISGISASGTTSGATISWTTNIAANSQVEYGASTAYGSLTTLDSNLVTGHSQTLTGLQGGTTYHFRVKSADGSGNQTVSGDSTFATVSTTPPVISAISASNITASGATITWTTNIASNSQAEYGTSTSYGTSTTLNSSLVTGHSLGLSGLQGGTTYHFRVRSTDGAGNLALSGDNTFATVSITPPVISAISASNITTSGATVTWTTNIASSSQVEYGTSTSYGNTTALNSSLVTGHSQTLTGLQGGTTYHFRVRSIDGAGNLALSGDNTLATGSIAPPVVSAISANNISTSGATITWTTNIASNSQVEYGTSAAYGSLSALDINLVTGHSQLLTGLQGGTTYHFRVKSIDGAGNLAQSGDNTFSTSAPNPTGPVISAITPGNVTETSVTISWTTNLSATSQVEYGTSTSYGSSTTLDSTLLTSHSQIINGLQAGTVYHFRVKSANGAGTLSTSGDNTFTTAVPSTGGGPGPLPPTGTSPPSNSLTPQQTPVVGGCGLVKNEKSQNPGNAADMLAIILLMFLALTRLIFRNGHIAMKKYLSCISTPLLCMTLLIVAGCGGSGGGGGGSTNSSPGGGSLGVATLSWTAPTTQIDGTPLTNLVGFKVYYGKSSKNYGSPIDIGNLTSFTITGLPPATYYFTVTAYDSKGIESGFSNEASKTIS